MEVVFWCVIAAGCLFLIAMSVKGIADHIFGDPDDELNKRKAIAQELIDQWEKEI